MAAAARDNTVYVQPSVRQTTTWTPALIRRTLSSADSGYLRQVASLCDAILGDERVRTDFQTRISSLLGLPMWFEEAVEGGGRERREGDERGDQVKALDEQRDWWRLVPEPQAFQIITWGLLLGVCPGRLRYPDKPDDRTGRLVPQIEFWHPQHLRWDAEQRKRFIKVGRFGSEEVELTPGKDGWLLYAPYGLERPWAMGLWRGLSRWWLLKSYSIDDSGRHSENAFKLVGKDLNSKSTKEQRKELASDIFSMGREGVIVLPPGLELNLLESKANFEQLYGALEKAADSAITISIRGQNLGTNVEGGSFAAAKSHLEVDHKRLRLDAETFSTFTHDQVLEPWAEYNWGDASLAPWAAWETEPPADEKQRADTLGSVARTLQVMIELGLPVDVPEVLKAFGVPLVEELVKQGQTYGRLYQYDFTFGIVTKNERRARLRLPAAPDGDKPAMPMVAPGGGGGPENRLASGFLPRAASGFVNGQAYADALTDRGAERGVEHLESFLEDLVKLTDGLTDLDQAKDRLLDFYEKAPPPEELAGMAANLFILSQLGGRAAVTDDAPEAKQ